MFPFIFLALILGFLFNLFLSKIDNPHGIRLMIIWGLFSVLSAILSISWTLSLNDIKNLHSIIGLGIVPYLMLVSNWIFVMPVLYFKYKVTVKTNSNEENPFVIETSNIKPGYRVKVTCIHDIFKDEYYVALDRIKQYKDYKIIGYIKENYAIMSCNNKSNLIEKEFNNTNFKHPLKEISDFKYWKVFIAVNDNVYVALFSTKSEIIVGNLQDVSLSFFLP